MSKIKKTGKDRTYLMFPDEISTSYMPGEMITDTYFVHCRKLAFNFDNFYLLVMVILPATDKSPKIDTALRR